MRIEESEIKFCCVATDLIKGEEMHLSSGSMVEAVRASISVPGIFTPFCHGDLFLGDGGIVNPVPVDVAKAMGADLIIAVNLNCADSTKIGAEATKIEITGGAEQSDNPQEKDHKESQSQRESSEASKLRKQSFLKNLSDRYSDLEDKLHYKVENWLANENPCPNIFEVIGTSLNVMEQQVTRSRLEAHAPDLLVEPKLTDYAIFDFHEADAIIRKGYAAMKEQLPALEKLLQEESAEGKSQ